MSTFLAKSFETIVAYKPGEQLGDDYLKLNTNESSQEPSPRVLEVLKNVQNLNYYNDPCQHKLRQNWLICILWIKQTSLLEQEQMMF